MSDPVTQVEIEDVLTSIRRLVSENGRAPERDVEPVEHHVVEAPVEDADRLVLTPALRVAEMPKDLTQDGEKPEELVDNSVDFLGYSAREEAPESNDEVQDLAVDTTDSFTNTDDEAVDQNLSGNFEGLQTSHENDALEDVQNEVRGEEVSDSESDFSEEFDEDEGIALSEAQAFDSRIVQWGRLGSVDEHPYEPDVPGDSDYAGTDVETLSWGASEISGDASPLSLNGESRDFEDDPAENEIEGEADSVIVAISELDEVMKVADPDANEGHWEEEGLDDIDEDAISVEPSPESDGEEADGVIPVFIPGAFRHAIEETAEAVVVDADANTDNVLEGFAGRIESEAREYVTDTLEESIAPELDGFDPDDTAFLDEAMLRDLVGEIVRQELQGALGERITRNVRKLVRREIHRALAAHELE